VLVPGDREVSVGIVGLPVELRALPLPLLVGSGSAAGEDDAPVNARGGRGPQVAQTYLNVFRTCPQDEQSVSSAGFGATRDDS
jgi:hypothetical protein